MVILLELSDSALETGSLKRSDTDLQTTQIARAAVSLGDSVRPACTPPHAHSSSATFLVPHAWSVDQPSFHVGSSCDRRPSIGTHAKTCFPVEQREISRGSTA